jgi:hypothetical protein
MPTFIYERPSIMLRRQCYIDMAPLVLVPRAGYTIAKTAVVGNPGVGKSLFAHELMAQLMAPTNPAIVPAEIVLYISSMMGFALQWTREGNTFEAIDRENMQRAHVALNGTTHWVIYDAAKGPNPILLEFVKCNHITLTSSNDDVLTCPFLTRVEPYASKVFMPPFSWEEAMCARPANVSQATLEARFQEFGGIARALLLAYGEPEPVRRINDPRELLMYVETIKTTGAVETFNYTKNNNVLAVFPTANENGTVDYFRPTVDFVSEAAIRNIIVVERQLDEHSRRDFVNTIRGVPAAAALCGLIFEQHAHALLANGGEFPLLRLLAAAGEQVTPPIKVVIPARAQHEFDTLADLAADVVTTHFCVPRTRNFPAIDSLSDYRSQGAGANSAVLAAFENPTLVPVPFDLLCGFQVTVSSTHAVNPLGLHNFVIQFGEGHALVFVVPAWMADKWHNRQRFTSSVDGSAAIPPTLVTQFALFLPFP